MLTYFTLQFINQGIRNDVFSHPTDVSVNTPFNKDRILIKNLPA